MKHIRIITAVLLCMGLFSCEKRHINDNMYPSSVYIINNGLQTEALYDVEGKTHTFEINTYCAGFYGGDPNVRLVYNMDGVLDAYNEENGTSYKVLPENCYKLDSRHKVMDDKRVAFTVTFDCDKIAALSNEESYTDIHNYVIPYTVVSETEGITDAIVEGIANIFIKPEMHKMSFSLVAPRQDNIVEDDESYSMTFKLETAVQNRWDSGFDLAWELTDGNGAVLNPENYTLTPSAERFTPGLSEITYDLKLLKSSSLDEVNIKTTIAKDEDGFEYVGKNVNEWKFKVNAPLSKDDGAVPGFERTRPYGDVCGNWLNDNNNPYKLINGSTGDYWGWNWNKRTEGGVRPEDSASDMGAGHPYAFIFDLSAAVDVTRVSLWRSNTGSNWKALGAGYIEFSTDRIDWTDKVEFDFTNPATYPYENSNLGPLDVMNQKPVSCRYIQLTLTRNYHGEQVMGDNNTMGAAFSELDVYISYLLTEVTE